MEKRGIDILDELGDNQFADDVPRSEEGHVDYVKCVPNQIFETFLQSACSGLWFLASEATDLVHRDASLLVPCIRSH